MKIGIVTESLDEGWFSGIPRYVNELVENLNRIDKGNEYHLIHYSKNDMVIYDLNEEIVIPLVKPFHGCVWKLLKLPLAMKFDRRITELDIVHYPANAILFPKKTQYKKIATIHDLVPILYPELHMEIMRIERWLFGPSAMRADAIISISENTKRDIIKYLKVPEEKIRVIYPGLDERFQPQPEEKMAEVRKKYKLDFPYILYVGTLEPRKNIPTLIRAYAKLKKDGICQKLVVAGKKGWKYKEIFELIDGLHLENDVVFTSFVAEEDLPSLYCAADLFVYPSFYEGFGLPPLEAMACGCPVITSNTSSLPEVVGDAGIVVEPNDFNVLASQTRRVLGDGNLRKKMSSKGIERAKAFSWEKAARETLKVYEEMGKQK